MVLAEKRDLWLCNEGTYSAYARIIVEMERLREDMEILRASPLENEALILKKEAGIGVLERVVLVAGDVTLLQR